MSILRDVRVWANRVRECRNPRLLASAASYDFQRRQLLEFATGRPAAEVATYLSEIEDDAPFLGEIRSKLAERTAYRPRAVDFVMFRQWGSVFFNEVTLYAIVRAVRPSVMVETGGTPGKSTAFILRAMERNGAGQLYTIDLPPQTTAGGVLARRESWHQALPAGAASGWIVPDSLRPRHTALLGKSTDHLPLLLAKLETIGIFLHDSDHSYENMMWEFETAWPAIKPGGLLLSDDVLDNTSFFDFCGNKGLRRVNVFNLGVARS